MRCGNRLSTAGGFADEYDFPALVWVGDLLHTPAAAGQSYHCQRIIFFVVMIEAHTMTFTITQEDNIVIFSG